MFEENKHEHNIAVLIDADNAPARSVQRIFAELASHGKVTIRRAYGNWKSSRLAGWESVLQEYAIQPFQQYDLTARKNATDIAMVVDAMDILHSRGIDGFCLVSSDCDFTPLATHILSQGKTVIGFGERKTPTAFVNVCSIFLYLDEEQAKKSPNTGSAKLKQDTGLINLIRDAISGTENEEGWAPLGRVGSHISNRASFDPRNYGYPRLSDLIKAIDLFELKRDEKKQFEIRDSRKNQGSDTTPRTDS